MDVTRDGQPVDGRFDVNKYTAWAELAEKSFPAGGAEYPVGHGEHQPVEIDKGLERNQFDTVFALRFGGIREGIGNRRRNAEFAQFRSDVGNTAVAEIDVAALQRLLEASGAYLGRDVN